MNHTILLVSLNGPPQGLPWPLDLTRHGIVMLRASNLREALIYCRTYELMTILVEIHAADEDTLSQLGEICRNCPRPESNGTSPPVLGVGLEALTPEDLDRLHEAGLRTVVPSGQPPSSLLWQLELLIRLSELKQYEQTRMDVNRLAARTRECLHDLSQPLSAVQGRLQLMAVKAKPEDPCLKDYQEMVKLILNVSQQVMEMQQINRKYS